MNIETTNVLKYTFMIVPFKIDGDIDYDAILTSKFFQPCDHKRIKYDRLYKHVADSIDENNINRTIKDFWVDLENNMPDYYKKVLTFRAINENNQTYLTEGYLKDIFVYCFENGIGFIVLNFVFDELANIDTISEILNKLKKINRNIDNSKFEIKNGKEEVDLFSILLRIKNELFDQCNLFFQHSSDRYVSAIMLNAFTYLEPQKDEVILHNLECLKRSQGNSYGTIENSNNNFLRPFKNMFWAFSTQGIANITYNDPSVGNFEFLKTFYRNVKREYLLMTLIVLNQEYTLLDYCQRFVSSSDNLPTLNDLNRLYNFKIHGTFTTVSHLEHYRSFYSYYSEELGIQKIFDEVNTKQNAIYLTNKNKIADEKARRDKNINKFTKVLSVILSIFGITGLINNVANLYARENALIISGIVLSVVIVAVAAVMIISEIRDKRFKTKSEHKRKKK